MASPGVSGTAGGAGGPSPRDSPRPPARSPIPPAPPLTAVAGWEVSARRAAGDLTVTDCTPLAKVQLRAPPAGHAAAMLGVPLGRAARGSHGVLAAAPAPGEWLLLAPPGQAGRLTGRLAALAAQSPGELVSAVDLTHGRALLRLAGAQAPDVLAAVCGIDLSDPVTPDGATFRTAVAAVACEVIRDDGGGRRSYLLACDRSYGRHLFDAMVAAGNDFGIEIDGFRAPGI